MVGLQSLYHLPNMCVFRHVSSSLGYVLKIFVKRKEVAPCPPGLAIYKVLNHLVMDK